MAGLKAGFTPCADNQINLKIMNLAEQLKKEILEDGKFDADTVTEYLVKFFKEQPDNVLAINFHDHCDWVKKGIAIDMNKYSARYGNKYGDLITLPKSWACDMTKFVKAQGFKVWEDRSFITQELHYLRVSLV